MARLERVFFQKAVHFIRGVRLSDLLADQTIPRETLLQYETLLADNREARFRDWLHELVEEFDELFEDQDVFLERLSGGAEYIVFRRSSLPERPIGLPDGSR